MINYIVFVNKEKEIILLRREIMIDLMQILISVTISGVVSWTICYFMYK